MSNSYRWSSYDKFEARSTDVLIGVTGPMDATELFLRSVGVSDFHCSTESGSVKPRRIQGHPSVEDRVVLVQLPPNDNTIGGLGELEVWLDEKYRENLHTRMRITVLLWLINTRDVPKPSLLFTSTAFGSLKPFFENGDMVHSTFPIILQFRPSTSQGKTAQRSNHEKFVKEKLKDKGDFYISAWAAERDGTPTEQLNSAIGKRDQRVMRRLSSTSDHKQSDVIIAVMGTTGTGKTNFIAKARIALCPDSPREASDRPIPGGLLQSDTKDIQAYRITKHPDYGDRVVLLDTPGFDDSTQDDGKILEKIGDWLHHTYRHHSGVTLAGILYFNRITDQRATGTALRNLKLLGNLCGNHAAANVVFITTMWDTVNTPAKETKAKERLDQYSKNYWKKLLDLGAQHVEFHNDSQSLENILRGITNKGGKKKITVLLDELVRLEKDVRETAAGQAIREDQEKAIRKLREECEALRNEIPNLEDGTEEKKKLEEQALEKDREWQKIAEGKADFTPPPRSLIEVIRQGVLQRKPGTPKPVRLGE